ncbi:MAG: N-acetylglucosamine-6-phosphate deacetylase [Pseudorhodobacter sp.]
METPGLFDLQVNGYAGVDFNDPGLTPAALDHALEVLFSDGVTGLLPTIITGHPETLAQRFAALDQAVRQSRLGPAMVPGYHLEGPFLNPADGYRGCHDTEAMTDPLPGLIPDLETDLSRPILLITLAPERRGGRQAIATLAAAGKTLAIGHSAALFDEVAAAATAGATISTHLGNGLPQMLPKLENTLLAQLAEPRLSACLIADGHHIPRKALAALVRLKGAENCLLVSDAVAAAAAPPGRYPFAGMEILHDEEGRATRPDRAGLAGSALRLDQAVRNMVDWDIVKPRQAIRMAGDLPRRVLARSLQHHAITLDPGVIAWDSALKPTPRKPA